MLFGEVGDAMHTPVRTASLACLQRPQLQSSWARNGRPLRPARTGDLLSAEARPRMCQGQQSDAAHSFEGSFSSALLNVDSPPSLPTFCASDTALTPRSVRELQDLTFFIFTLIQLCASSSHWRHQPTRFCSRARLPHNILRPATPLPYLPASQLLEPRRRSLQGCASRVCSMWPVLLSSRFWHTMPLLSRMRHMQTWNA